MSSVLLEKPLAYLVKVLSRADSQDVRFRNSLSLFSRMLVTVFVVALLRWVLGGFIWIKTYY
jgi:thiamine transporter ThiT